jgi:hypothetical protein
MKYNRNLALMFVMVFILMIFAACATTGLPLFKVSIKAVDETDTPISGAVVESSDGQMATTGKDGLAIIKLGSVGARIITVSAENKTPAVLTVTMPIDINKTMTARLGNTITGGASPNVNLNIRANYSAMLTAIYPMMFQYLFTAYGYNMEVVSYKAGEWTEWNIVSDEKEKDQEMSMRKEFLTKLDNKQEWWQVGINFSKEKADQVIIEVLFAAERESIRRMRQQTGEGQASEVPVTEGWYSAPMNLTPESMEGSVVKRGVDIKVPAGSFKADLMEFSYMGTNNKIRMWRVSNVPGGIVRVEVTDGKEAAWATELKAYGDGAKTVLSSY